MHLLTTISIFILLSLGVLPAFAEVLPMPGISTPDAAPAPVSPPHAIEKLSNIVTDAYTIGAEDVLEITVWRNQDLSKIVQVRPDGRFSLPVIRDVVAVGKTPSQLADEITRKLKEYVQNPVVAISVKEVNMPPSISLI